MAYVQEQAGQRRLGHTLLPRVGRSPGLRLHPLVDVSASAGGGAPAERPIWTWADG